MNVKNLSIILISSMILSGCALNPFSGPDIKPIEVQTVAVEKTPLNIQEPKPINPQKVEWFIITPENANDIFAELEKKKFDVVLYGLTDDGYQNLSMNLAEFRKYIIQQKGIIKGYKEYYEPEKPVEK